LQAFTIIDGLQEEIKKGNANNNENVLHGDVGREHEPLGEEATTYEPENPNFDPKALEDAIKELYGGSKCTKLTAIILFMNLCIVHGINNKFANELFTLLHFHLLHVDNCLPNNYYATKTLSKILMLDYKNIHACGKRCVLYQEEYKDVVYCPKCGASRYNDEGNKLFHVKVLRHLARLSVTKFAKHFLIAFYLHDIFPLFLLDLLICIVQSYYMKLSYIKLHFGD